MTPSFAKNNAAYACLIDAKPRGKIDLPMTLCIQAANFPDLIGANLGTPIRGTSIIEKPVLASMQDVGEIGYVLQIINAVIRLVAVLVVDGVLAALAPYWARRLRQKGNGNKRMNRSPCAFPLITKGCACVAALVWFDIKHAPWNREGLSVFANDCARQRLDTTTRRNFVQSIKASNGTPFFNWLFDGMIGVHENLHFSAEPPNDSTRCGGNFIGVLLLHFSTDERVAQ